MPVQDAGGRWLSDDGRWWWDGSGWQEAQRRRLTRRERLVVARDAIVGLVLPWLALVALRGFDPPRMSPANFVDGGFLTIVGLFAIPLVLAACSPIWFARPLVQQPYGLSERLKNLAFGALMGLGTAMPVFFVLAMGATDSCVADSRGGECSGFTSGMLADFFGFGFLGIAYFIAAFVVRRRMRHTGGTAGRIHA